MSEMNNHEDEVMDEVERRYYLCYLLTEEMEDQARYDRLDAIAQKLDEDTDGALDEYMAFEKEIITHYADRFKTPEVDALGEGDTRVASMKSRLKLLSYVAELDEDEEWKSELVDVAKELQSASAELPYKNVERFLCDTGFGGIYETRMSAQKTQPSSAKGTTAYWDEVIKALPNGYSKPAAVLDAVLEMKTNPARVPQALRDVLGKAVALAGG